ncbi:MAG: hypothetical protein ABFD91_01225 [Anaerohalosphaeraceae bacterium]
METKTVLITVKAYPNPSKKYTETVCCAGVDINQNTWIRLYPIPFRDLDSSKQFSKYNIIEVRCHKSPDDHRIESHKVDSDSIKIIKYLDTKDRWGARKNIILPLASTSFCKILADTQNNRSLGIFKPTQVEMIWEKAPIKDKEKRDACYAQLSFFDKQKDAIEQIPYNFYYQFKCDNLPNCPGHKLMIVDWELGQAFRNWRTEYKPESILFDKIKEKWLFELCGPTKDTYFYVGNVNRFRNTFLILGVFYPPKHTGTKNISLPFFST